MTFGISVGLGSEMLQLIGRLMFLAGSALLIHTAYADYECQLRQIESTQTPLEVAIAMVLCSIGAVLLAGKFQLISAHDLYAKE